MKVVETKENEIEENVAVTQGITCQFQLGTFKRCYLLKLSPHDLHKLGEIFV